MPRTRRARGEPHRRDHRQPVGEGVGKRGAHADPVGFDAAKKIKGIKRHLLVDTGGLMLAIAVGPVNVQDRNGAPDLVRDVRRLFPWLAHLFADQAYAGPRFARALGAGGRLTVEIVKRNDGQNGFAVLPRRWVVERTLA